MTYGEQRVALIERIRANRNQYNLALCPTPLLEDFYIFTDFLNSERFIIHRKEIDE